MTSLKEWTVRMVAKKKDVRVWEIWLVLCMRTAWLSTKMTLKSMAVTLPNFASISIRIYHFGRMNSILTQLPSMRGHTNVWRKLVAQMGANSVNNWKSSAQSEPTTISSSASAKTMPKTIRRISAPNFMIKRTRITSCVCWKMAKPMTKNTVKSDTKMTKRNGWNVSII